MKSLRYLSASLALCGLIGGASAFADGGRSVVVVNQTSYTLVSFYASSSDAAGWDTTNNLLTGNVAAGGQTTIPISGNGGEDNCQYDLMGILDGASQAAYQYQVNACNGDTWTITQ
jgi:hypothetical protein